MATERIYAVKAVLGFLALILNLIGYVPYIREILSKVVKPQRTTWGIWTILTTVAAVNQVQNGGGFSSLFFISTAALVATTFLLSLKRGQGGASKVDIVCLVLAIALFAYWAIVRDTELSTYIAVGIDTIALVPTLIKTYRQPETEIYTQWVLAGIGGLLSLLAAPRMEWVLIIYPLYVFVANGAVVTVKYLRERS